MNSDCSIERINHPSSSGSGATFSLNSFESSDRSGEVVLHWRLPKSSVSRKRISYGLSRKTTYRKEEREGADP